MYAQSLNRIGTSWDVIGDYSKSLKFYKKSS